MAHKVVASCVCVFMLCVLSHHMLEAISVGEVWQVRLCLTKKRSA